MSTASFPINVVWNVGNFPTSMFNQLESSLTGLDKSTATTSQKITEIGNSVEGLNPAFQGLDKNIDGVSTSLEAVNKSVQANSSQMQDLRTVYDATGQGMDTAATSSEKLTTNLTGLNKEVTGVQTGLTDTNALTTDLTKTQETATKSTESMGTSMATVAGGITTLVSTGVNLYNTYDAMGDAAVEVEKKQIALDRINVQVDTNLLKLSRNTEKYMNDTKLGISGMNEFNMAQQEFNSLIKSGVTEGEAYDQALENLRQTHSNLSSTTVDGKNAIDQLGVTIDKTANSVAQSATATADLENQQEAANETIVNFAMTMLGLAGGITSTIGGLTSMKGSLKNMGSTAKNMPRMFRDLSSWIMRSGSSSSTAAKGLGLLSISAVGATGIISSLGKAITTMILPALGAIAVPAGIAVLAIGAFVAAIAGIRAHFKVFSDLGVVIGDTFPPARDALNSFKDAFITMSDSVLDGLDWLLGGFDNLAGTNIVETFRQWREGLPPVTDETGKLSEAIEKQNTVVGTLAVSEQQLIDQFFAAGPVLNTYAADLKKVGDMYVVEKNGVTLLVNATEELTGNTIKLTKENVLQQIAMGKLNATTGEAVAGIQNFDASTIKLTGDLGKTVYVMADGTIKTELLAETADKAATNIEKEGESANKTSLDIEKLSQKTKEEIEAENNLIQTGLTLDNLFANIIPKAYAETATKKQEGMTLSQEEEKIIADLEEDLKQYGLTTADIDKIIADMNATKLENINFLEEENKAVADTNSTVIDLNQTYAQNKLALDNVKTSQEGANLAIQNYFTTKVQEKQALMDSIPLYQKIAEGYGITKEELDKLNVESLPAFIAGLEKQDTELANQQGQLLATAANYGLFDKALQLIVTHGEDAIPMLQDLIKNHEENNNVTDKGTMKVKTFAEALDELADKKQTAGVEAKNLHMDNLALIEDYVGKLPEGLNLTAGGAEAVATQIEKTITANEKASSQNIIRLAELQKLAGEEFNLSEAMNMTNGEIEKEIVKLEKLTGTQEKSSDAIKDRVSWEKQQQDAIKQSTADLMTLAEAHGANVQALGNNRFALRQWIRENQPVRDIIDDVDQAFTDLIAEKKLDAYQTEVQRQANIKYLAAVHGVGIELTTNAEIVQSTVTHFDNLSTSMETATTTIYDWYHGLVEAKQQEEDQLLVLMDLAEAHGVTVPKDMQTSIDKMKEYVAEALGLTDTVEEQTAKIREAWKKTAEDTATRIGENMDKVSGILLDFAKSHVDTAKGWQFPKELENTIAGMVLAVDHAFNERIPEILAIGVGDAEAQLSEISYFLEDLQDDLDIHPDQWDLMFGEVEGILDNARLTTHEKLALIQMDLGGLFDRAKPKIMAGGATFLGDFQGIFDKMTHILNTSLEGVDMATPAHSAFEPLMTYITSLPPETQNAFAGITAAIKSGQYDIAEVIGVIAATFKQAGIEFPPEMIDNLAKSLGVPKEQITTDANTIFENVNSKLEETKGSADTNMAQGIPSAFDTLKTETDTKIAEWVTIMGKVAIILEGLPPTFSLWFGKAGDSMSALGTQGATAIEGWATLMGNVATVLQGLPSTFEKWYGDAGTAMKALSTKGGPQLTAFVNLSSQKATLASAVWLTHKKSVDLTMGQMKGVFAKGSSAAIQYGVNTHKAVNSALKSYKNLISGTSTAMRSVANNMGVATSAANRLRAAINSLRSKSITVTTTYVTRYRTVYAARGFTGFVSTPTHFVAGEAGLEFVDIQPVKKSGNIQRNTVTINKGKKNQNNTTGRGLADFLEGNNRNQSAEEFIASVKQYINDRMERFKNIRLEARQPTIIKLKERVIGDIVSDMVFEGSGAEY